MVAETLTSARAASTFPVFRGVGSGFLQVAWGSYAIAANVEAGDIFELCRVPAGATVLGGMVFGADLDTNATETLDMDIGWAANGAEAADPDGFGNLGVWVGDAIADWKPTVCNMFPLQGVLATTGPVTFTRETVIQLTAVAAAATFAAGTVSVAVYYVVP